MKYRAKANREVRELTPSEVAALVPWLWEPIEEGSEDERRDAAVLTPERPLETRGGSPKRRSR